MSIKIIETDVNKRYITAVVFLVIFGLINFFLIFNGDTKLETGKSIKDLFGIIFVFSIFFLVGLLMFFRGYKNLRKKRLIEDTPTSKIRSIAMGFVEVCGKALPWKKLITSPFKQEKGVCCFYAFGRYHKGKWIKMHSGVIGKSFYIKDDTGKVLVDLKNVKLGIPYESECNLKDDEKQPPELKKLIDSNKLVKSLKNMPFSSGSYKEFTIKKGDVLYVMGNADDNPHKKEATAVKGREDIMIQKGDEPFYISNKKEFDISKEFGKKARSLIFVGGALILFAILFSLGVTINIIRSST